MGCLKLHISEHQYKRTELKVSYINKELTLKNSAVKERSYLKARYYDPKWSIFINVDPLAESYPDWSSYTYVYNNPIRWTDSTGMCPDGDCPDNPVIGQVHNSPEFGELVFDGQTWTITKCPQVLFLAFQEAPHHCKLPVRLPCPQNLLLKELMIF